MMRRSNAGVCAVVAVIIIMLSGAVWAKDGYNAGSRCYKGIYQKLWNTDMKGNGLRAGIGGRDTEAPLLIFETTDRVQKEGHRLLVIQDEELLDRPTYRLYRELMNYYEIKPEDGEVMTAEELETIWKFIDAAMDTEVMKQAYEFLSSVSPDNRSGYEFVIANDEKRFRKQLFRMWFELFSNNYKGHIKLFASGFEHVFVGEHGARKDDGSEGDIGGYHFWYQYYLAERAGHGIKYTGVHYSRNHDRGMKAAGMNNPEVATFSMSWDPPEQSAQSSELKGFFVGLSPEGLLALGTVAYFQNKWDCPKALKNIVINGQRYNLVLYRNTLADNQVKIEKGHVLKSGDHIVSFYPSYEGRAR